MLFARNNVSLVARKPVFIRLFWPGPTQTELLNLSDLENRGFVPSIYIY